MSIRTSAMAKMAQSFLKVYKTRADMISYAEQIVQYDDQVMFIQDEETLWRKKNTTTQNITDYDQISLSSGEQKWIPLWDSTVQYSVNAIVAHGGELWSANVQPNSGGVNRNRVPGTSNDWTKITNNTANIEPRIPSWDSTFTYSTHDICAYEGRVWVSQTDNNLNSDPIDRNVGTNPNGNPIPADETVWKEYKQHFFDTASPLEIGRTMGLFHPDNGVPRRLEENDLNSARRLVWSQPFRMWVWL